MLLLHMLLPLTACCHICCSHRHLIARNTVCACCCCCTRLCVCCCARHVLAAVAYLVVTASTVNCCILLLLQPLLWQVHSLPSAAASVACTVIAATCAFAIHICLLLPLSHLLRVYGAAGSAEVHR
ncbi:hypothetical protein ABBQ32_013661 [Trebouxia sp. C0010 RCD-2024]